MKALWAGCSVDMNERSGFESMRKIWICIGAACVLLMLIALAACTRQTSGAEGGEDSSDAFSSAAIEESTEKITTMAQEETSMTKQTGYSIRVPDEYKTAASRQGALTQAEYDSKDYVRNSIAEEIRKVRI